MNSAMDVLKNGAVAVLNKKIVDLDAAEVILEKYSSPEIISGEGRVVMPGFINTHTHAAMVYFRGLADDLPLKEWLENHIWPAEGRCLSPEFVYDAVELACLEMLKSGTTTFSDMYFFADSTAKAAVKMGMRAVVCSGVVDFPTVTGSNADDYLNSAERFINDWSDDALIRPGIAAHSAYTCSPDTLKKICRLSDKCFVSRQIHLSETEWEVSEIISRYGKRPAVHLDNTGFFDGRSVAAHCVWVDAGEIDILAKKGVGVSHCIESNLKLASGIAPVPAMLKAGAAVSFGTDGAASNNDMDLISEMSTAAKVHKAVSKDPTVIDAATALRMATIGGAKALGMDGEIGSIEKGKYADLVAVNLKKPHLTPLYSIYSHMVYSLRASDVETVMVNGRIIIDKGRLILKDEDEILKKAGEWAQKVSL
ncbi:MAG: amidohydrolase [Nitrospirae bacterium]|nr:MAG: amidohydrolase [Nitrospirota bacterium]